MDIEHYEDEQTIFADSYSLFCKKLLDRDNRPELLGRFIFIDESQIQGREDGFWHIASIGEDFDDKKADYKFDMYPCQNHVAYEKCIYKCEINHPENYLREINSIPCIYRAHKINWVWDIINLVNENRNHENLYIWRKKHHKSGDKRLFIRYLDEVIDYIIIFQIVYNKEKNDIRMYKFITAYPVVMKSYKAQFDKDFNKYAK